MTSITIAMASAKEEAGRHGYSASARWMAKTKARALTLFLVRNWACDAGSSGRSGRRPFSITAFPLESTAKRPAAPPTGLVRPNLLGL